MVQSPGCMNRNGTTRHTAGVVGVACQVAWSPNGSVPTKHSLAQHPRGLQPERQAWPAKQYHKRF